MGRVDPWRLILGWSVGEGDKVEHRFSDDGHVRIVNDGELVQPEPQDTIAEARARFAALTDPG